LNVLDGAKYFVARCPDPALAFPITKFMGSAGHNPAIVCDGHPQVARRSGRSEPMGDACVMLMDMRCPSCTPTSNNIADLILVSLS